MSAAHTPGPWVAELWNSSSTDDLGWNITRNGSRVPTSTFDGDVEEAEANARLIAAAPELLEALRTARCCVRDGSAVANVIDAAIAKATGGEA